MIPPRPWHVDIGIHDGVPWIISADPDSEIVASWGHRDDQPVAALIVRLVNAEPEIVAALEAALQIALTWKMERAANRLFEYKIRGDEFVPADVDADALLDSIQSALKKVKP